MVFVGTWIFFLAECVIGTTTLGHQTNQKACVLGPSSTNHLQFCNKITKGLTCQAKELRFHPVTIADAKKKTKICWKNGVMIPATSLLTIIVLRPLPRLAVSNCGPYYCHFLVWQKGKTDTISAKHQSQNKDEPLSVAVVLRGLMSLQLGKVSFPWLCACSY